MENDRLKSRLERIEKGYREGNPVAGRTLADYSDGELLAMTDKELLAIMGVGDRANPRSLDELASVIRVEMRHSSPRERVAVLRSTPAELAAMIEAKRDSGLEGGENGSPKRPRP